MVYFIGICSGAISGIGLVLILKIASSNQGIELNKSEILFSQIFCFILVTFFIGPFLTYLYAQKYSLEGPDAILTHAFFTPISALPLLLIGLWQNRKKWVKYLASSVLFILGICWLLPLAYNLIA